jgi:hypothetical protein
MKNYRWLLAVALAVIIVLGFWIWRRGTVPQQIDLLAAYESADKRSNLPINQAFRVTTATIENQERRAIFMHPTSRLIFKVTVPRNASLSTFLALAPRAWENEKSDGVLFRFGVSDGRKYDELLNQHVNPHSMPEDRRWIPVTIDLSPYAGQQVDLVFNTNTGPPPRRGRPSPNANADHALWGEPRVMPKT